jgi:hypothetical protein
MNTMQWFGITALFNLIFGLMIISTCRCSGFHVLTRPFRNQRWFMPFYEKHCLWWTLMFISLLAHMALGVYLFGWPWSW